MPPDTKPWQGLPGVYEMVEDYDGDAYRAIYLIRRKHVIYILHAFQKKSPKGRKTEQLDVEAIEIAFKSAIEDYRLDFKKEDDK